MPNTGEKPSIQPLKFRRRKKYNPKPKRRPPGRPRLEFPPDEPNPNDLARWMAKRKIAPTELAKLLCVDLATVYGWRKGNRPPGRRFATRLERISDGDVPASGWEV